MKLRLLTTLLYLFALFWVAFAVAWFLRDSAYRYLYSTIGAGYSLVLFLLAYFIGKKQVWAWWTTTILVGIGILVSIFDETGWSDIVYLAFSLLVFITLLKGQSLFTKKNYGKNQ